MYSFIPSWYEGTGEWHAHIAPWYQKAQSYEFDDTVNQLRMFRDAGEETELLCLAFFRIFADFCTGRISIRSLTGRFLMKCRILSCERRLYSRIWSFPGRRT